MKKRVLSLLLVLVMLLRLLPVALYTAGRLEMLQLQKIGGDMIVTPAGGEKFPTAWASNDRRYPESQCPENT